LGYRPAGEAAQNPRRSSIRRKARSWKPVDGAGGKFAACVLAPNLQRIIARTPLVSAPLPGRAVKRILARKAKTCRKNPRKEMP
jgi:hypothetical protein